MVQMLGMSINQAFTSNLLENYENEQYLNTAPEPPHLSFQTKGWLLDTLHFQ